MDFSVLVAAFSDQEFRQLERAVWARQDRMAKEEAITIEPTQEELALMKESLVKSITALRVRVGCNLRTAKCVFDRYRV